MDKDNITYKGLSCLQFIINDLITLYYYLEKLGRTYSESFKDDDRSFFKKYFVPKDLQDYPFAGILLDTRLKDLELLIERGGLKEVLILCKASYNIIYEKYYNQLNHLNRNLFIILNFLEESFKTDLKNIRKDSKQLETEVRDRYRTYFETLKLQMSTPELVLLFYHGLTYKDLRPYIYKYGLIDYLYSQDLVDPRYHRNLYREIIIEGVTYPEITIKNKTDEII